MDEGNGNGKLRTPMMEGTEEPPHVGFSDNLNNAFMGKVGVGDIVERKDHARDELSNEEKKDNAAGKIPAFVFVRGNEFRFREVLKPINIVSFLKPS
jgi:hypothetical protein